MGRAQVTIEAQTLWLLTRVARQFGSIVRLTEAEGDAIADAQLALSTFEAPALCANCRQPVEDRADHIKDWQDNGQTEVFSCRKADPR
jgi:hypothetical protein